MKKSDLNLVILGVVVVVTLVSGADYFLRFWKRLGGGSGGAPKEPPQGV